MSRRKKHRQQNQSRPSVEPATPSLVCAPASWTQFLVAIVVLGGAVWAVYGYALHAPLIFDDEASILDNPSITRVWPLVGDDERGGPLNAPTDLPTAGRPLVNLSLAINYYFGRLDPAGYRAVNIVLHWLSAILVWSIVRCTLQLEYFGGRFTTAAGPIALAVALLWALHPLQTESVVYVTQRTELMVGLAYLATLYSALRYWTASSRGQRTTWLVLATLACSAGMASKEVMVTSPVVVLLYDWTFLSGSLRKLWQKSWPLYVALAATWGLLLALNYEAPRAASAGFHLEVPAYAWWLTQAKVLLMYLKLVFWPWPLCIHYEMPYMTTAADAWPWLLPVVLLVIGTLILLWRRNAVGYVGAWVLLILSPTLIVPIVTEVAAERRMYLPLAALVALVVVGAYWLAQKLLSPASPNRHSAPWTPAATLVVPIVALALVFAAMSARRLEAYNDELTLWQGALAQQPESSKALCCVGKLLAARGQYPSAIEHFHEALRIYPEFSDAHLNMGIALFHMGRPQQAMDEFVLALQSNPNNADAQNNLGNALASAGHMAEAIPHFEKALEIKPNYPEAMNNLGSALLESGRADEAVARYRQAVAAKPDFPQVYVHLTLAYAQLNRRAEAVATAQQALDLARTQGNVEQVEQLEAWLRSYRPHGEDSHDNSPSSGPTDSTP